MPQKPCNYLMVLTNCKPGEEATFAEHYDRFHLPEVVAVEGVLSGQRFARRHVDLGETNPGGHEFLAIYEIEGDPAQVAERVYQKSVDGGFTPFKGIAPGSITMVWAPTGPTATNPG